MSRATFPYGFAHCGYLYGWFFFSFGDWVVCSWGSGVCAIIIKSFERTRSKSCFAWEGYSKFVMAMKKVFSRSYIYGFGLVCGVLCRFGSLGRRFNSH